MHAWLLNTSFDRNPEISFQNTAIESTQTEFCKFLSSRMIPATLWLVEFCLLMENPTSKTRPHTHAWITHTCSHTHMHAQHTYACTTHTCMHNTPTYACTHTWCITHTYTHTRMHNTHTHTTCLALALVPGWPDLTGVGAGGDWPTPSPPPPSHWQPSRMCVSHSVPSLKENRSCKREEKD